MSEEILINGKKITELSDMFFEYCELKKENEDLKTYIQKMDKPEIKTIDSEIALKNIELQKENEGLKKKNKELFNLSNTGGALLVAESTKNKKYKQALEEIRELAEVNSINTCWTILNNCNDCHNNNECGEQSPIAKLKFIKDKVNEVLNDRD